MAFDEIARALSQRSGAPAVPAQAQGRTYYPVNPLGPFSGPTAADFPNGQGAAAVAGNPGTGSGIPGQFNMGGQHGYGMGGQGWDPTTLISTLPQQRQDIMTQRWGMFGGGAPMPTTIGDFRTAKQAYYTAHPELRPQLGGGQWQGWQGHSGMMGG